MVGKISLISILNTSADSIGQVVITEQSTDVYADITSISQSEFMQAGQIGLKPDLRFDIWETEYNGETILEYNSIRYSIYRTYMKTNGRIELYTEKRVGNES